MDETDTQSNDGPIRRRVLNWIGGLGVVAFFGSLLAPLKDLQVVSGSTAAQLQGQQLVVAEKEFTPAGGSKTLKKGDTLTADSFSKKPDTVLASPANLLEKDHYIINLYYLEESMMTDPTKMDWTDQGFVAYSAVCTHLGCTVGWEDSDSKPKGAPPDKRKGASALCPCHLSDFDVYHGSEVVSGPAPRPVPQIGVKVADDGSIVLTSDFEGKIGPGK